jgi:hypothetical protein
MRCRRLAGAYHSLALRLRFRQRSTFLEEAGLLEEVDLIPKPLRLSPQSSSPAFAPRLRLQLAVPMNMDPVHFRQLWHAF